MSITTEKLSRLVDVKTGFPLRKAAKSDPLGDARLVQMKNVDPVKGINWDDAIQISTQGKRHPDWLQSKDVLFVGRGSRFFATYIANAAEPSVASPHFYVLRSKNENVILPEFLTWFLNSKIAQKFYTTNQEGSALPYISRKTLAALPIELPDIATQKSIINTYMCWKKQHRLLEELIEQKGLYINALLEQTLKGEIK